MLTTMNSELQKEFEEREAFDMMVHLKGMFQEQARQERFTTTKALNACKMTPSTSVSTHVLKMKGVSSDGLISLVLLLVMSSLLI